MRYFIFILLLPSLSWGVDKKDFFERPATLAVALTGGDTNNTYSTACINTPAVMMRAAVTDRSRRKICFQNTGNVTVNIGSTTYAAGDLWTLGESTNSATLPIYCTNSSSVFYCSSKNGTQTVQIIEETQSVP